MMKPIILFFVDVLRMLKIGPTMQLVEELQSCHTNGCQDVQPDKKADEEKNHCFAHNISIFFKRPSVTILLTSYFFASF